MINKKILARFFILTAIIFVVIGPAVSYGIDQACANGTKLCNPIKYDTIQCFFKAVLKLAAEIGSVFVVLGIIYSGFLFVSARGNAEELGKAKRAITYTVIGAALVFGAWAFSVGIANTVNTILNGAAVAAPTCP